MHSNFTRVVMGSWLFLVLILSSSYTASLSSMLTVQQLKPNITDIEWLKTKNLKIGCDGDSFVRTYLENVVRFKPENIINISHENNYVEAFKNHSIAAAFLELPYEKAYISEYCKGYSGSTPTTTFGGLGFMFQKGSPVARDVSKAILQLAEQGELKNLEKTWLTPPGECSDKVTDNTGSLNLGSFWVLYVISGATSTICLVLSTIDSVKFRQAPQNVALEGNGTPSDEKRVVGLAKQIYSRKLNNASDPREYVTDSSARREYVKTTDTPKHQQAMASQLPDITIVSSPPAQIQMTTPAHI